MKKKKNKKDYPKKSKINWKVVIYSFSGLIFLGLMFFIDWLFIIPAVIMMWLNQKEIMKKVLSSIENAEEHLYAYELASVYLKEGISTLDEIDGHTNSEEILNTIFSKILYNPLLILLTPSLTKDLYIVLSYILHLFTFFISTYYFTHYVSTQLIYLNWCFT